ncbi:MAG: ATP-binding cassette, subfamily bacterial, partial [Paraburkholderia sp.]|nr:ATP-binding cassette, subfamily bacterial [Paraburkholderia sp.]
MFSSSTILKDYIYAYRVATLRYGHFPYHILSVTVLLILLAGIDTAVPYVLREATNRLASIDRSAPAIGVVLAGAYGVSWTTARVFERMKAVTSAAMLARCDAAFQYAFYTHLMRIEYRCWSAIDFGAMLATLTRSKDAFSQITFSLFWVLAPIAVQLAFSTTVLCKTTGLFFGIAFVASMLVLFVATWVVSERSKDAHRSIFDADTRMASYVIEKLTFCLDIKINAAYENEKIFLGVVLNDYVKKISGGNARLAILLSMQVFFTGLLLTIFTVLAAMRVTRAELTIGDFAMIVGYVVSLTAPFTMLAASLSDLKRSQLALREGLN